jgi:hypothetical protein
MSGCGGRLDAGFDVLHGPLPVDERSAVVVVNDGALDNWQGEYAAILAASGQLELVGFVVNSSSDHASLEANVAGYRQMFAAARESGMRHLPEPTASVAPALTEPTSGSIEDTIPNRSEGARLILAAAAKHGTPAHPLAIATGGALTDVADAYLVDPSLAERAVVVRPSVKAKATEHRPSIPMVATILGRRSSSLRACGWYRSTATTTSCSTCRKSRFRSCLKTRSGVGWMKSVRSSWI